MTHPTHADEEFAPILEYSETVLIDDFVRVDRFTTASPRNYRATVHQGYILKAPQAARAYGSLRLNVKTATKAINTSDVYTVQTRSGVTINAADGERLYPLLSVTDLSGDELRRPGVLERLIAPCLIPTERTSKPRKTGRTPKPKDGDAPASKSKRGGRNSKRKTDPATPASEEPQLLPATPEGGEVPVERPEQPAQNTPPIQPPAPPAAPSTGPVFLVNTDSEELEDLPF